MFPVVRSENLILKSKTTTSPVLEPAARCIGQGTVRASEQLLKDTITCEFSAQELLRTTETVAEVVRLASTPHGFLYAINSVLPFEWIRQTKLAKGVHENNAILERTQSGKLRVRLVKSVEKGGEIYLWFSEEICSFMQITFLRLDNIQGQYRYMCHECQKTYENPNPLKIHLATKCEMYSVEVLYHRLSEALSHLIEQPTMQAAGTLPPGPLYPRYSGTFVSRPSLSCQNSAFIPTAFDSSLLGQRASSASIAAATHLETIVSNMGTSKDGHICIYCGKLYSRKYGLKIHIRTHTGFKPLKCKYCFRPFGDPSNLNKHLRLHAQGSASYKCNICNKVLVRRRDLQRHVQTRHGISAPNDSPLSSTSGDDEEDDGDGEDVDIDVSCDGSQISQCK